jgi:transcriptional regulator with XRE-family HTH domain
MAIVAQLEENAQSVGTPRDRRHKLRLEAQGALASGDAARVLVHNISATGLLLECPLPLAIDERIAVELPHAGPTWARVVWTSGSLFGCQFKTPISAATLSASQLRSAVGQEVAIPGRSEAVPDASFGSRLQRLRADRGLSQTQVAASLGVSKPTVWAWEHGKARPAGGRIEALAQVLGVQPAALLSGAADSPLDDLITRSRAEIAAAAGTRTEKVRIWIEL